MLRVAFALLFGLITPATAEAQPLTEAAAPLAARISSLLPRRTTVSLEFQALTPLAMAASSRFLGALQDELRKTGLDVTAAQAESRVRVVVSENARGLLLVAELPGNEARPVILLPWSRAIPNDTKPALRLVSKPVWEQAEPVLDLLLLDSESQLLVLSPTRVSAFRMANGKWALNAQASLSLARPVPRDPRGRLEFIAGVVRAFLPGTTCNGPAAPQLAFACAAGNEPWQLNPRDMAIAVRWVSDRNTLESDGIRGSFFSAGAGLFASSSEKIEDRTGAASPGTEAWGSEIAAMENICGSGNLVIAATAGESEHDRIQAFEMVNGQPVARNEALALPGPVTALWPAETPGQATLVVRNSKTGNYEASRLALACAE